MYSPGSPWGGYPPPQYPPPQSGVVYVPVYPPAPTKGKGRGKNNSRHIQPLDVFAYLEQAQNNLDKAKKMFKEEKKDDKKDETPFTKKRFSLLETVALNFIFGLPTSFALYLLYKAVTKLGGL